MHVRKKMMFVGLLLALSSFPLEAGWFGGGKGGGALEKILEYVEKDMTANVSEQLEQIARWKQQVEQWEKELSQKVGLSDSRLKNIYHSWEKNYRDAQAIYNDLEQMNMKNVLDYKKFERMLLEAQSQYDTSFLKKTEEDMKVWKKNIDNMSKHTAEAKDKFTGQLLNIQSDATGEARRKSASKNAESLGATDKQIQQKMLNSLSSLEHLMIEQNEVLASQQLVGDQVREIEKQKEEARIQKEKFDTKRKEEQGIEDSREAMPKMGTTGKKIGFPD